MYILRIPNFTYSSAVIFTFIFVNPYTHTIGLEYNDLGLLTLILCVNLTDTKLEQKDLGKGIIVQGWIIYLYAMF